MSSVLGLMRPRPIPGPRSQRVLRPRAGGRLGGLVGLDEESREAAVAALVVATRDEQDAARRVGVDRRQAGGEIAHLDHLERMVAVPRLDADAVAWGERARPGDGPGGRVAGARQPVLLAACSGNVRRGLRERGLALKTVLEGALEAELDDAPGVGEPDADERQARKEGQCEGNAAGLQASGWHGRQLHVRLFATKYIGGPQQLPSPAARPASHLPEWPARRRPGAGAGKRRD